jgi:hypothetical protein
MRNDPYQRPGRSSQQTDGTEQTFSHRDIDNPMRTERPLSTTTKTTTALHDPPAPVRAKLAAAWTSFMFFYIYVDYLHLYRPGVIDDILAGVVFEFDISQTFVVISIMLVGIPSLMILLSTILPARANRTLNLVVASLYIPVSAFNVVGESWMFFYGLGAVLEVIVLAVILRSAWTWPRTTSPSMPEPAAPYRPQIQMGR